MAFILKIYRPYPDELLSSWVYHLADDNGLSFQIFAKAYLDVKNPNSFILHADGRHIFLPLYRSILSGTFSNIKNLYLQLTTFQFESMCLTPGQQTRYANYIFRKKDLLNTPIHKPLTQAFICPKCFKEDSGKYGRPYFHRSHQLSGVRTCYKHGIKLMQYTGDPRLENQFNYKNYKEIESNVSLKSLQEYTAYAQALFEAQINTNLFHLKDAICTKLKELGYGISDDYASFIKDFKDWKYAELSTISDYSVFFRRKMMAATYSKIEETMPILMFLFPDVEELINKLQGADPVLQMYTCPECGEEYCSTPQAEADGWGCPYCNSSIQEKDRFKHIVETAGHGEYQVLSDFKKMNQAVRLYHKPCGKETLIQPCNFLFKNQRCHCETITPFEVVREEIESYAGFKLIKFKNKNEPLTIYHEACGQTFQCGYADFLRHPVCRICHSFISNTEAFKKCMKELVGDEYTLIGEYTGSLSKVKIRHNICGTIQEYSPDHFLEGQRCRECRAKISLEEYKQLLESYSHGQYIIVGSENNNYIIQNTTTGDRFRLARRHLLQEIRRPTPSPILPLDGEAGKIPDLTISWDQKYDLLVQYKNEFGTVNIPINTIYHGFKIGKWCSNQRESFEHNRLTENQISKLNALGFIWNTYQTKWERKYGLCVQYLAETGKKKIPKSAVYKGENIGTWISTQKARNREGKLPTEQKEKLLDLIPDLFS